MHGNDELWKPSQRPCVLRRLHDPQLLPAVHPGTATRTSVLASGRSSALWSTCCTRCTPSPTTTSTTTRCLRTSARSSHTPVPAQPCLPCHSLHRLKVSCCPGAGARWPLSRRLSSPKIIAECVPNTLAPQTAQASRKVYRASWTVTANSVFLQQLRLGAGVLFAPFFAHTVHVESPRAIATTQAAASLLMCWERALPRPLGAMQVVSVLLQQRSIESMGHVLPL